MDSCPADVNWKIHFAEFALAPAVLSFPSLGNP